MLTETQSLHDDRATASLRHLWGVVLPAAVRRPPVSRRRRHYTGPGSQAGPGSRRAADREALDRIARLIPSTRRVVLGSRPVNVVPDVFLAALRILQQDPYAVVAALPSDHLVDHGHRLMHYVVRAAGAAIARPDLPIIVAAYPGSPDPDYAWVDLGESVDGLEAFGVRVVRRLVPHPSALERAGALLGTVAIVASARTLVQLGRRHLPDVLECLEPLEHVVGRPEEALLRDAVWESMPHASLCGDLLARVSELGVVAMPDAMTGEWSRHELQALAS
jgi:mannose-1-phosphate guanylyltransferase